MYLYPLKPRRGGDASTRDAHPIDAPHSSRYAALLLVVTLATAYSLGLTINDSGFSSAYTQAPELEPLSRARRPHRQPPSA